MFYTYFSDAKRNRAIFRLHDKKMHSVKDLLFLHSWWTKASGVQLLSKSFHPMSKAYEETVGIPSKPANLETG